MRRRLLPLLLAVTAVVAALVGPAPLSIAPHSIAPLSMAQTQPGRVTAIETPTTGTDDALTAHRPAPPRVLAVLDRGSDGSATVRTRILGPLLAVLTGLAALVVARTGRRRHPVHAARPTAAGASPALGRAPPATA